MKKITILLLFAASLFLASCASDTMKPDDMNGMDHGNMENMSSDEHARMKM
jgi:outer membrane biogenesis lipoprotein LolB